MSQNCTSEMTKEEKRDFYKNHGMFGLMSGETSDASAIQKELQANIEMFLDDSPESLVDVDELFA